MPRQRHIVAFSAAVLVIAALGGCTSTPPPSSATVSPPTVSPSATPSTTVSTPSASATPTPSATVVALPSVTVPSTWKPASAARVAEVGADPNVTGVVGVWTTADGTEVAIVQTANDAGTTSAPTYFSQKFGNLGPADGVDVTHTATTTDAGDALLLVGETPAGGLGGDTQAMFFVLTPHVIVSAATTPSADGFADFSAQLAKVAKSVKMP